MTWKFRKSEITKISKFPNKKITRISKDYIEESCDLFYVNECQAGGAHGRHYVQYICFKLFSTINKR